MKIRESTVATKRELGQLIKEQNHTGWNRDRTNMLRIGGTIISLQIVIGVVRKDTSPGIVPYRKEGGIRSVTHVARKGTFHGTVRYGKNGEIRRLKGGGKEGPDKKTGMTPQKAMGKEEEVEGGGDKKNPAMHFSQRRRRQGV